MADIKSDDKTYTPIPKIPSAHWLLKNFTKLASDPLNFMADSSEKYGGLVELNISPWVGVYLVTDPDIIKSVLVDNQKSYKKSFAYEFLRYALGNGLLTNEGESWLNQRRIIQPGFHRERLASLAEGMVENINKMIERWERYRKKENPINIAAEFMQLTTEIAAKALFSHDIGDSRDKITEYITIINEFIMGTLSTPFRIPLWVPTKENLQFKKALKDLDGIIYSLIESRRKSTDKYMDLLTMLIEAQDEETGEKMNDLQLRDEVVTLFLAGSETSSNALAWTAYLLEQHPEIRKNMYEEIAQEIGGDKPNAENILKLKYTSMVIHESMRLYPPAWVIGRQPVKDVIIDGNRIKKGSQFYISNFVMHRHKIFWDEPEKFDPSRFAADKIKQRHKFAYFPFGAGPRFCIGNNFAIMEITIALVLLAQNNFTMRLADQKVAMEPLVTLRPKNGLWMYLD
ncbi:MAG TPA: cytochrome P450 [Cytophagales bacterium]|nr:cytochrome P450 [Cytophagales bacterium]